MTDKEFRHMSRVDLIEIIYKLQKSEKLLREENESLRQKLQERHITVSEAGSIAEAAIALNGVMEAAQAAADQYLLEVRTKKDSMESEAAQTLETARNEAAQILGAAKTEAAQTLGDAESEAAQTLGAAKSEAAQILGAAKSEAAQTLENAKTESARQWQLFREKTKQLLDSYEVLRTILEPGSGKNHMGAGAS